MKKLKVLVTLLAMFSLFSLTNASAVGKDYKSISNNFNFENEIENFNENSEVYSSYGNYFEKNFLSKDNMSNCENIALSEEGLFYNEQLKLSNMEQTEHNDMIGKKRKLFPQQYSDIKAEEKNQETLNLKKLKIEEIQEKAIEQDQEKEIREITESLSSYKLKLSGTSKGDCEDDCFAYFMLAYGRFLKNKQEQYKPELFPLFYAPYLHMIFSSSNGYKYKPFDVKGKDLRLFEDFFKNSSKLAKYFGTSFEENFKLYYINCFKKNLNSSINVPDFNGGEVEINRETLQENFKYFYNTLKKYPNEINNYKQECRQLIDMFFSGLYLKSFFIFRYYQIYNFYDRESECREDLIRFSEICSRALRCEFYENGYLKRMKLDFSDAAKSKEDMELLKRLYGFIEKKEKKQLLYKMFFSASVFLKQTEFWNKMFEILTYCKYIYDNGKILNNIHNCSDVKDYDFNSLHERFKYIFLMLAKDEEKKGFLSEKNNDLEKENCDFIKSNFLNTDSFLNINSINYFENEYEVKGEDKNKEFSLCDFTEKDKKLKKCLDYYFNYRFKPGFSISQDFKWLTKKFFDDLCSKSDMVNYKLLGTKDFYVSKKFMLEYLNKKLENEKIREECLAFVRFLFKMYLTKGFVTAYGCDNKEYADKSLIEACYENFDDMLDVRFEKENNSGKYMLKLNLKKHVNLNCVIKDFKNYCINRSINLKLNYFIKNIQSNSIYTGKQFVSEEKELKKVIYRSYLSTLAFVEEENFLNNLLAFLVCNHSLNMARNVVSDGKSLCNEYKKTDMEFKSTDTELLEDVSQGKYIYTEFGKNRTDLRGEYEYNNMGVLENDMNFDSEENFSLTNNEEILSYVDFKYDNMSYEDILKSSEQDILELTDDLKNFSKFEKKVDKIALVDKDFVDYIFSSDHNVLSDLGNFNDAFTVSSNNIMSNCENREDLSKNFSKIFSSFCDDLEDNNNINNVISDFENFGITDRYCVDFSYDNLKNLFKDLCSNIFMFYKNNHICYDKNYENYYNYILENEGIANECVSFIERFFRYYVNNLSFNKNVWCVVSNVASGFKNRKRLLEARDFRINALKNIVKPILGWFCNIFKAKVKDKKIKFNFNLGQIYEEVSPNIKVFFEAIKKYSNNPKILEANRFKCLKEIKEESYEDRIKKFLFKIYLDVLAFLNSEDFWNEYMKKIIVNSFINSSKNEYKVNDTSSKFNIFGLKYEFLDVAKNIKGIGSSKIRKIFFSSNK